MNFKKEFSRLNALSHKDPKWYCNFDKKTGVIYSVKNHNNDSDSYITIEHTMALDFNNRNKSLDDYQIVWNKDQKKYKLLKKTDTTIESVKNTFMEITNNEVGEVVVTKNYKTKEWQFSVDNDVKERYNNGTVIEGDALHFSVTAKCNPHILYRTITVSIVELFENDVNINFDNSDIQQTNFSIYTNKKIDSYAIKELI
jgi:hypothetical protein